MAKKKSAKASPAPRKKSAKRTPPRGNAPAEGAPAISLDELEEAWDANRDIAPTTGASGPPDIPDGDYIVQLQAARIGQYRSGKRKGVPYLSCTFVVLAGEYSGTRIPSRDDISNDPVGETGRTQFQLMQDRIKLMGVDLSETTVHDFLTIDNGAYKSGPLIEELTDPRSEIGRPYLSVRVSNRVVERQDGEGTMRFQSVYVNQPLSEADVNSAKHQLGG